MKINNVKRKEFDMKLTEKITIRFNKSEEKFIREKSYENKSSVTDIVKAALNKFYNTDIFILSQDRNSKKWSIY